jgi:hypothetical protein
MKTFLQLPFLLIACFTTTVLFSQDTTNMGKEFWVAYGHHQFMANGTNTQQMTIYIATGSQPATVTVTIDSSSANPSPAFWWWRTYNIPANTVIDIETTAALTYSVSAGASGAIPKTGTQDARLYADIPPAGNGGAGLFRRKGIHIESNVPVVAYSHIYGTTSSGATMLVPVEAWGGLYTSANSEQSYASDCYSWLYVIAKYDNTVIEITPTVKTKGQNLTGLQPGAATTITLMRGQVYQVLGANTGSDVNGNGGAASTGYQLTGTKIRSITSPTGYIHPIAVFSGSSRTLNPASCGQGGGDNDMQQHFPRQAMGKIYLTAPFSGSSTPSSFATCKYKVIVFDPTTVVSRNGVALSSLVANGYYEFESNTPDRITADQPILVAQFMTGGSCLGAGGLGDPEMVYLSPLSQGTTSARFYRNTKENISVNYLTIIVPTTAVATTTIDGSNIFDHTLIHPQDANYTILVKRWNPSAQAQAEVQSTGSFVGTTYGLGSVESYGYNVGTNLKAVNARDASVLPPGFTGLLPVTLLDFNAVKNLNDVVLKWNTSYEINFDRFEAERSTNGAEFNRFAVVKSNQSISGAYTTNDMNALKLYAAEPVIYYRLKMIDKDGKFKYSGVVTVKSGNVRSLMVQVTPNPFDDKIQLQVQSVTSGTAKINVRDISGKLIERRSQFIAAGSSAIEITSLENLQKGIYLVEIEMNGIRQQVKAVK